MSILNVPARKVVQLVYAPEDKHHFRSLVALCNDGTIWLRTLDSYDWVSPNTDEAWANLALPPGCAL